MPDGKMNISTQLSYDEFIKTKVRLATTDGFDVDDSEINPILKPHQQAVVKWAVKGGKRALFESFGLGKSIQQLEILRLILKKIDAARDAESTAKGKTIAFRGWDGI